MLNNSDIYWRRYTIQETLYIGQWRLSPLQSRHLGNLTQFSQSLFHCSKHSAVSFVGITIRCPVVFSCISLSVWNLFPFKGDFSFGKSQSCRAPNLGYRVAESPGWQMFVDCSLYTFNILRCSVCCRPPRMWITFNRLSTFLEAFVPHFYLRCTHCIVVENLNHPNSFHVRMMQIHCSTHSVILNVMATQYTFSLNGITTPTD